jgi:hypothetical protein
MFRAVDANTPVLNLISPSVDDGRETTVGDLDSRSKANQVAAAPSENFGHARAAAPSQGSTRQKSEHFSIGEQCLRARG